MQYGLGLDFSWLLKYRGQYEYRKQQKSMCNPSEHAAAEGGCRQKLLDEIFVFVPHVALSNSARGPHTQIKA